MQELGRTQWVLGGSGAEHSKPSKLGAGGGGLAAKCYFEELRRQSPRITLTAWKTLAKRESLLGTNAGVVLWDGGSRRGGGARSGCSKWRILRASQCCSYY
jgi:hypothetical protein